MRSTEQAAQLGSLTTELERALDALREGARIRGEARRLYGSLLPRFVAQLLERADDAAQRADRHAREAQQLAGQIAAGYPDD